jgi:hypothetical protein
MAGDGIVPKVGIVRIGYSITEPVARCPSTNQNNDLGYHYMAEAFANIIKKLL